MPHLLSNENESAFDFWGVPRVEGNPFVPIRGTMYAMNWVITEEDETIFYFVKNFDNFSWYNQIYPIGIRLDLVEKKKYYQW